jgi:hypothetical protein
MTTRAVPGRGWFLAGTILTLPAGLAPTAGQFTPPLISGVPLWPFFLIALLRNR